MRHEFWKAQVLVERAIDAVDAANAQLALGGMYVSKAQTQLLAWEEAEKSKEDEHAQRKLNEQELERWKEEAKERWKVFNNSQKAEITSWHKEKAHLAALKQKAPPKPLEVQMREWMAKDYPQLQQNKPFTSLEDAGQSVEAGNICPA
ncbi:uncharacterized protein EI90DRAFT_3022924 [Cantharellus anzutake]|uniref:uncharacterized protein n=1 Tax=Cantharellus anzutake TaxID=1750568 RepID=UPI001906B1BF|nr:uncharacterized protein EI90DRAFT_3022924 [Cantharellus anzutake]KAF8312604.1 hypothetical protein EI90DRAFT_3022924 [Cantharellus anzutake]